MPDHEFLRDPGALLGAAYPSRGLRGAQSSRSGQVPRIDTKKEASAIRVTCPEPAEGFVAKQGGGVRNAPRGDSAGERSRAG